MIDDTQNTFINGTMKLNNEISDLNDKIKYIEKERDEFKNKYEKLLLDLDKNSKNFQNLQNIMTKLREKDDIDITLIEERYIVLENVLELEKNEIVNINKELINKVKILTQKNGVVGEFQKNNLLEGKDDINNTLKLEIKNLTEENKLLQLKIKEQEKRLFQLQKKTDILNMIKEENQTLKNNLNENNVNLQVIIKELTSKTNQLNEELLQSRKRTSLLRSKPNFENEDLKIKINNKNMSLELEKYQKEIESLKSEISQQKQKSEKEISLLETEISSLKTQRASDEFKYENEKMELKNQIKKYKEIMKSKGINIEK
jgi:chromosome segregation ATPase